MAGKQSVSLSGEEVIARARHLLLSFFALIKATRTRRLGESLLLNKLKKRARQLSEVSGVQARSGDRGQKSRNPYPAVKKVPLHRTRMNPPSKAMEMGSSAQLEERRVK
jgi:hypothetical protein